MYHRPGQSDFFFVFEFGLTNFEGMDLLLMGYKNLEFFFEGFLGKYSRRRIPIGPTRTRKNKLTRPNVPTLVQLSLEWFQVWIKINSIAHRSCGTFVWLFLVLILCLRPMVDMTKLFVFQKGTCVFWFKAKRTNPSHLLLIVFFLSTW